MSPSSAASNARNRQILQVKILTEILNSILVTHSSQSSKDIASLRRAITVDPLISPSGAECEYNALPGGLADSDIRRFASPLTPKVDQQLISDELDATIRSISHFYNAGSDDRSSTWDLPHDIETKLGDIKGSEGQEEHVDDRIQQLLHEINEIHPRLHQRLVHTLKRFPQDLASRNVANNDLLAMTIEASLVKVSLIRAQALNAVYSYQSPKHPALHMKRALSAAYAKLAQDEREMEEEERKLDRELAEYQTLLDMVDGGVSSGFRQVVADCACVEKETEECRRDLRRLGWTGED